MKSYVYAVRDVRTGCSNNPTVSPLMKADFAESIKRGVLTGGIKPEAAAFAELYYLGVYDDQTMMFELEERPELILKLGEYCEEPLIQKAAKND